MVYNAKAVSPNIVTRENQEFVDLIYLSQKFDKWVKSTRSHIRISFQARWWTYPMTVRRAVRWFILVCYCTNEPLPNVKCSEEFAVTFTITSAYKLDFMPFAYHDIDPKSSYQQWSVLPSIFYENALENHIIWTQFKCSGQNWSSGLALPCSHLIFLMPLWGGGRVWQRCHVSYVTGASNWYWLTVGKACYPYGR